MLKELWKDEEGLSTVEYALLLALVAIAAWRALGGQVSDTVDTATGEIAGTAGTP